MEQNGINDTIGHTSYHIIDLFIQMSIDDFSVKNDRWDNPNIHGSVF